MTDKEQTLYDLFGFGTVHVNYLINISKKYKYIYFETPKVGCSTIKRTLQKLETDFLSEIPEDVHNKSISPLLSPLQLEKNFTEYLTDEYFKFSFVRNPYTRILSCYLDKILGSQKNIILPQLGYKPTDTISFEDFLLAVKKQSYSEMNVHWMPQHILLASSNITLDFIGKQENFDNDLQKVLSIITNSKSDAPNISNERPHAVGANDKLQKYITEDTAKLIQEIYNDDFYLYGYSKNPFNTLDKYDLVSIVIPCYNQAQYLEEAVQSAINQTYPNIEIIIVNDGSSDSTQKVAKNLQNEHPNIINIISQKNLGLSEARNTGIKNSSGKYIVPLDADDKLDKEMVRKCVYKIEENKVDIVYSGFQGFGTSERINMWIPFEQTNPLFITPCSATALFKKEVWEINRGYKSNMSGGYEDWEFWINAYKHNMTFLHLPEKLFFYRIKEESMFTDAYKKDDYLKAKIVMNHPELYTINEVNKNINLIKEAEELADVYFYGSSDLSINTKYLANAINFYLRSNSLKEKQLFNIPETNKTISLYSLNSLKDSKQLKKIYSEENADFILFYAPLRYEISSLQNLDFAWAKEKGIIKTHGSTFPFLFKDEREDYKSQLLAYERLVDYQNKKNHILQNEIERQVNLRHDKDILIQKKDILIKELNKTIVTERENSKKMINSIRKVSKFSIKTSPLKKYKAYKELIQTYILIK